RSDHAFLYQRRAGLLSRCHLPQRQEPAFPGARYKNLAVRAERHRCDRCPLFHRTADKLARIRIPQPSHSVPAPGQEELAVRTERDGIQTAWVLQGRTNARAGGGVPLLSDEFSPALGEVLTRDNSLAIGAEAHARDFRAVTNLVHQLTGGGIPLPN